MASGAVLFVCPARIYGYFTGRERHRYSVGVVRLQIYTRWAEDRLGLARQTAIQPHVQPLDSARADLSAPPGDRKRALEIQMFAWMQQLLACRVIVTRTTRDTAGRRPCCNAITSID